MICLISSRGWDLADGVGEDFLLPVRMAARVFSIRPLSPWRHTFTVPSGLFRAEPPRFYMIASSGSWPGSACPCQTRGRPPRQSCQSDGRSPRLIFRKPYCSLNSYGSKPRPLWRVFLRVRFPGFGGGAAKGPALRCLKEGERPGSLRCKNLALPGKPRCRLHGGLSTGPRSESGKARVVAAMVAGRKLWLERLRAAEGLSPLAGGKGSIGTGSDRGEVGTRAKRRCGRNDQMKRPVRISSSHVFRATLQGTAIENEFQRGGESGDRRIQNCPP